MIRRQEHFCIMFSNAVFKLNVVTQPELGRSKQEDHKFKTSQLIKFEFTLGCLRPCLRWGRGSLM